MTDSKTMKKTMHALLAVAFVGTAAGLTACGQFKAIDPKQPSAAGKPAPGGEEKDGKGDGSRGLADPAASPTPAPGGDDDDGTPSGEASRDGAAPGGGEARRDGAAPGGDAGREGGSAPPAPAVDPVKVAAAEQSAAKVDGKKDADAKATSSPEITDDKKMHLLLKLVEKAMKSNFRLLQARIEITEIQKKLEAKTELTPEENEKIMNLRTEFNVPAEGTFNDLLQRVDGMHVAFMLAPLIQKTAWGTKGDIADADIASRVKELNTGTSDEAIRFRSARHVLSSTEQDDKSRQLTLAELSYNPQKPEEKKPEIEDLLGTVDDIRRVMGNDEAIRVLVGAVQGTLAAPASTK